MTTNESLTNERWVLASHPDGLVRAEDFRLERTQVRELEDGEFLVAVEHISLEPALRTWLTGQDSYLPGARVGDPIASSGVGRVVRSRNPDFPEGAHVTGGFGWQRYAIASVADPLLPQLLPDGIDPTWSLSVLGLSGL
ncbi:MAG: NADP-dependent oxidoreductase, partial [Spirulina sp.]